MKQRGLIRCIRIICGLHPRTNPLTIRSIVMLLPVFQDLIKPQWRTVIETLKRGGCLPATEIALALGCSYMSTKTYCEELTALGYVIRTRTPRAEVGRPEIFYSLSTKAEWLFPQVTPDFTLELLDEVKRMYGESAPEKLLFQHFQKKRDTWKSQVQKSASLTDRCFMLAKLRRKDGYASEFHPAAESPASIEELHNPLQLIFAQYPRGATLEQRIIEELLETRVIRKEITGGRESSPRVLFEIPASI